MDRTAAWLILAWDHPGNAAALFEVLGHGFCEGFFFTSLKHKVTILSSTSEVKARVAAVSVCFFVFGIADTDDFYTAVTESELIGRPCFRTKIVLDARDPKGFGAPRQRANPVQGKQSRFLVASRDSRTACDGMLGQMPMQDSVRGGIPRRLCCQANEGRLPLNSCPNKELLAKDSLKMIKRKLILLPPPLARSADAVYRTMATFFPSSPH